MTANWRKEMKRSMPSFKLSRAQVRFVVDYLDAPDEEKDEVLSVFFHDIWNAAREANVTITVLCSDEDEDAPEWDGTMVSEHE